MVMVVDGASSGRVGNGIDRVRAPRGDGAIGHFRFGFGFGFVERGESCSGLLVLQRVELLPPVLLVQ